MLDVVRGLSLKRNVLRQKRQGHCNPVRTTHPTCHTIAARGAARGVDLKVSVQERTLAVSRCSKLLIG